MEEVEPVHPRRRASTKVIPIGKTYLSWLYFDDDPDVQRGQ